MNDAPKIEARRADAEIPNLETLRERGIKSDLGEGRLLLVVASRLVAYGDSKSRNLLYEAMSLVGPALASEVKTDDAALPALLPPLPPGIPVGRTALRRLGITARELVTAWELGPPLLMAALPFDVIVEFLPPPAWPYLASFVACSPSEAGRRLNEAIKQRAQSLTVGSLVNRVKATWVLMRLMTELRDEFSAENKRRKAAKLPEFPLPSHLDEWSWLPPTPTKRGLIKMGASQQRRDTSAVPVEAIRHGLKQLAREAHWGKWKPEDWPLNVHWFALKRLATLGLLATVAPRIDHLHLLDVDDFAWHRFADGTECWGFRGRGEAMKMRDVGDVYWKKLPPELAKIIHGWIVCSGRELDQKGAPLFIPRKVLHRGGPGKRYADYAMSCFITGARGRKRPQNPLIPFADNEWKGYQAHRYRSFVTQHVEGLVHAWKLENPGHPLAGVETKVFGELLLDHGTGDMGYRDYDFGPRYEQIVGLGIELIWDSLWGDAARRRGLDVEQLREARERAELLQAQMRALEHEVEQREYQKAELKKHKAILLTKARKLKGEEREDARFELDALRDGIEDLNDDITATLRKGLKVKDELSGARERFAEAKTREVVLPDELGEEDYRQQLATALGDGDEQPILQTVAPMASELLPDDVAELFGVHPQSIWRWRTGKTNLPNPRPFDPAAWVMHDNKDFRLPADAINVEAIPASDPQAALHAIRRKRAALGSEKNRA